MKDLEIEHVGAHVAGPETGEATLVKIEQRRAGSVASPSVVLRQAQHEDALFVASPDEITSS